MDKRKKAEIVGVWLEKIRNREIQISRVSRETGLDYKWLLDFLNDGVIADQVRKVKILDRYFKTEDFDIEKYVSEKIQKVEDTERLI